MDISLTVVVSILIILFAATVAGLGGFGFSLISAPLLVIFIPSREVVPIIILLSIFLNLVLFLRTRKDFQPRRIWPLMVGGAIGIPFGTCLLLVADPTLIKFVIGLLIMIFGFALLFEVRKKIEGEKRALGPIGLVSGILNGSVSMSGPPVILLFQNQRFKKDEFRANLIGYFFVLNIITLPIFLVAGLMTEEVVLTATTLVPGMVFGSLVGCFLAKNIDNKSFRRLTLVIVICAGMVSITTGLGFF